MTEFTKQDGTKLVDEYSEVKTQISELKKKEDELKKNLIGYSKQFEVDAIMGSDKKCSIKEFDKCVMPEDKAKLIEVLKASGVYETYSMLSYSKINSGIIKGEISDSDIRECIEVVKDFRVGLAKRAG